jgi:hypothetical protein
MTPERSASKLISMAEHNRMTTPDDPDFEGAQFISREAMIQHKVTQWPALRDIEWTWSIWTEWQFEWTDTETGVVSIETHDHDHCMICHEAAFSERFHGDLRSGWRSVEPSDPASWLCPDCFDRFRDQLGWTVAG